MKGFFLYTLGATFALAFFSFSIGVDEVAGFPLWPLHLLASVVVFGAPFYIRAVERHLEEQRKLRPRHPEAGPHDGADGTLQPDGSPWRIEPETKPTQVYVWQVLGRDVDGRGIYKIGITGKQDAEERMRATCKANRVEGQMLYAFPFASKAAAQAAERHIHDRYADPARQLRTGLAGGRDGYTEFRVMTDRQRDEALQWLRDQSSMV